MPFAYITKNNQRGSDKLPKKPALMPVSVFEGNFIKKLSRKYKRNISIIPIVHEGKIEEYDIKKIKEYNIIIISDNHNTKEMHSAIERLASWIIKKKPMK